jgi:hypothetical protein
MSYYTGVGNISLRIQSILIMMGLFIICLSTAVALAMGDIKVVTGLVLALGLFVFGFLSPRIAIYLLIFSMLLSPEFGARDISGRGFTIRFEDILLIIMGFAWLAKSAIIKEVGLAVQTPINKPILYYMLVCVFSTSWGIINGTVKSPLTGTFFIVKYFEYFVVFFITLNIMDSKSQYRKILLAIFLTYIIVLAVGLSQIPSGERISAPFEGQEAEPNTFGGYLLIMLSLNIALYSNVKRKLHKVVLGFLAVVCFIAILYTLSRATWIGLIAMYLPLIYFIKKRNILLIAFVIGMIIAPILLPKAVINRALYTFNVTKGSEGLSTGNQPYIPGVGRVSFDTSTEARFDAMHDVYQDFYKHPILGFGVTGYYFIDAQFHRVLIETGLIGLSAFLYLLWVVGSSLFRILKQYRYDPLYNTITIATFCSFIGLVAHCIGTNSFIIVRIMEPFWCLVGLVMSIPIIESKTQSLQTHQPLEQSPPIYHSL